MTTPEIVSRSQWLTARKELLTKEKEATRARDAVNAERRALPMVELETEYVFDGPESKATLADLFDGRRQLIVYHAMFHPDWISACPSCSYLIDSIPHRAHLRAANTNLVLVSRAPINTIEPFRTRMGWTVPWYSSYGSDFNYDFHATLDPSVTPPEYNYQPVEMADDQSGEVPGVSVFLRDDQRIFHTYSSYARGGDILLSTFNYLDLTPFGRQENEGIMNWVRLHDEYDGTERP